MSHAACIAISVFTLLIGLPSCQSGHSDADPHAGHAMGAMSDSGAGALPAGYAPVTVDSSRVASLGLATVPVEERDFTKVLRTVGVVTLDETRSAHVHAKVRGWIDGIFVNFVGRKVNAGEPLCAIYSQEVYAAELEFLSILDRTSSRKNCVPVEAGA